MRDNSEERDGGLIKRLLFAGTLAFLVLAGCTNTKTYGILRPDPEDLKGMHRKYGFESRGTDEEIVGYGLKITYEE